MLKLLPKHKGKVAPAAIEAGFSSQTAYKQGKSLLKTALKKEARETLAILEGNSPTTIPELKKTMAERIGMTRQDVMNNIKWLAEQERDLATRLKVVKALAKEYEVDLGEEELTKVNVPILNVTVKENKPLLDGPVEP